MQFSIQEKLTQTACQDSVVYYGEIRPRQQHSLRQAGVEGHWLDMLQLWQDPLAAGS